MKRAAVDHPKLQRLQRRLGLTRFQAMGLMEAVWHFTGRYAPEGDIGRWADEEIAAWVEWDRDTEELMEALVVCGWLDQDPKHRLLVHDWPDHASDPSRRSYLTGTRAGRRRQRMKAAGGWSVPVLTREAVFARDGYRCQTCGAEEDLTIDHRTPITRGGTHDEANLQSLCRSCNSRKRDR